jgi:hypothetical protein
MEQRIFVRGAVAALLGCVAFLAAGPALAGGTKVPAPVLRMIVQLKFPALVPTFIPKDFGSVVLDGRVAPEAPAPADGYSVFITSRRCAGKPDCAIAQLDAGPIRSGDPLGTGTLRSVNLPDGTVGYTGPPCAEPRCANVRVLNFVRDGVQYSLRFPRQKSLSDALAIAAGLRPATDFISRPREK